MLPERDTCEAPTFGDSISEDRQPPLVITIVVVVGVVEVKELSTSSVRPRLNTSALRFLTPDRAWPPLLLRPS